MTYDERQEIGIYLDIVKKNAERLVRSVEMMQDALGKMNCIIGEMKQNNKQHSKETAKEEFLKKY